MFVRLRRTVREIFFLQEADRESSRLSASQRQSVRAHGVAAARRIAVARQLREPTEMSVALSLYRDAVLLLIYAFVLSKDDTIDADALTPDSALDRLEQALGGDNFVPPPAFAAARPLLVARAPLSLDRLNAEEAGRKGRECAAATRWLTTLIEMRSPAELKLTRIVRRAAAALCVAALVAWLGVRIASPRNVALDKLAVSSSAAQDTAPSAAVDGWKTGRYGFHSGEEDSPWLSIDLGAPHQIATVKVFGRGDCCFDQSVPLAFEASDDGTSFRKIAERTDHFSESDPWVITPGPLVARFVRLRTERRSFLVLSEVEVYGTPKK